MLATMSPELQKMFMEKDAYAIYVSLQQMFQTHSRHERFVTMKALVSCKMAQSTPVGAHVLKMKGYLDAHERLEVHMSKELATDLILGSLTSSYDPFVMNYYMHWMNKSVTELHGMLKMVKEIFIKQTSCCWCKIRRFSRARLRRPRSPRKI